VPIAVPLTLAVSVVVSGALPDEGLAATVTESASAPGGGGGGGGGGATPGLIVTIESFAEPETPLKLKPLVTALVLESASENTDV